MRVAKAIRVNASEDKKGDMQHGVYGAKRASAQRDYRRCASFTDRIPIDRNLRGRRPITPALWTVLDARRGAVGKVWVVSQLEHFRGETKLVQSVKVDPNQSGQESAPDKEVDADIGAGMDRCRSGHAARDVGRVPDE